MTMKDPGFTRAWMAAACSTNAPLFSNPARRSVGPVGPQPEQMLVRNDPASQELAQARAQLSQLRQRYTEAHPEVRALAGRKADNKRWRRRRSRSGRPL